MKKIMIYALSLFLLIGSVLAANLTVSESVEFDQTNANSTTTAKSFTITPDAAITNVVISSTADSKYDVKFSETESGTYTSSLPIASLNAAKTLYVKSFIPDQEESGTKTIGNIAINADELASASSIPLKVEVRGRLYIVDFDAKIGSEDVNNIKDGDKINKNLKPGDAFSFTIKVENTFENNAKIDINNIVTNILIVGFDTEGDLEEDSKEFDLSPNEDESETFEFKTPLEIDEGDYEVQINIEGRDDNGIVREVTWDLTLSVEKESHDVKIQSASLSPVKIVCGGTSVLSATLYNLGKNTEEEVKLVIKSPDLGINIEEYPIELDNELLGDESKWSKTYAIPVSASQSSGTYAVEMWAYFNEDILDDYKKLELNVEQCSKEEQPVCGNSKIESGEECDDGNAVNEDGCSSVCKKEQVKEEKQQEEEKEEIEAETVITETKEEGIAMPYIIGFNVLILLVIAVLVFFKMKKGKKGNKEEVYKNF